ncbi:glycoside hydrolase family 19 protein [Paraburkholderia sp. PREW-6R]|uniref:glycoside hydrolase family 19 protein n=1 Tax=Paraburkholderia sp. PREW-6R TaxID=3141544 RepID=UPI0031F49205
MTSQPATQKAQTPAPARLKPLPFAFPFLRKGRSQSEASARFTDEREIYRLLADREPSGAYLVSRKGMWHGGIHVTEAGAGQSLDLDAGLRCIADGVLIAFRANKTYPFSEIAAPGEGSPAQAPYSTGFALVRHTMEFPPGTKLTFYSLYMHLMSSEDYANFPNREKPSYWPRQWQVTPHAQDKPSPGRNGQVADPAQQGLRVRRNHPHGEIIGILPQGASVSIGRKEKDWGLVTDLHGTSMYPPDAGGYVEPSRAVGSWIYLGQENGGRVVEEVIPDAMFDRVIVTTDQTCTQGDQQGTGGGIPIKAADLIGHLGRYDSLSQGTSGTRMAHIEVFCDDSIQPFLEQGRAWVNRHGPHKEDWSALGLPTEPTILRIAPGTVLYQRQDNKFVPGADPQSRKMHAVRVYSLAELARDPKRRLAEPHPNPDPGYPVTWWHVDGVNAQGQPIDGWVCDFNHASGRVTREFAQKWIDFECVADTHDPAHTIFAANEKWVDYASGANIADVASRSNLSPLMLKVYDALFTQGDGRQAADELCTLSVTESGRYPWGMPAASRLIVKHDSEWANPSKSKQLIAELEKQTGPKPQHEEEQKRIDKLAWWDDVKMGVMGFPESDVHHLNPIAIASNFASKNLVCKRCGAIITLTPELFNKIAPGASAGFVSEMARASIDLFPEYGVNSCRQMGHLLSQAKHETRRFTAFRESLNYQSYTGESLYRMAPTAIDNGFARKNIVFASRAAKVAWIQNHLIANDAAYGEHCFGANEQPGKDFRGRGLLHLTHYETYKRCAQKIGYPIDSQPELVENNPRVIIETGLWFWTDRGIGSIADSSETTGDEGVKKVTRPINPGYKGLSERQQFKREISAIFNRDFSSGCIDE